MIKTHPRLPSGAWMALASIQRSQAWEGGSEAAVLLEKKLSLPGPCLGRWVSRLRLSSLQNRLFQLQPNGELPVFMDWWCLVYLSCRLQAQPDLPEKEKCLAWTITFWLWRSSWTSSRAGPFWKSAPMKVSVSVWGPWGCLCPGHWWGTRALQAGVFCELAESDQR